MIKGARKGLSPEIREAAAIAGRKHGTMESGSNPRCISYWLCELNQVSQLLCAPVSSSAK